MSESAETVAPWAVREALAKQLLPLLERYDVKWRGHGWIYVDHQQGNIVTASLIVSDLSANLGVPAQQVHARLTELGWLRDVRYTTPSPERIPRIVDERADDVDESDYDDDYDDQY